MSSGSCKLHGTKYNGRKIICHLKPNKDSEYCKIHSPHRNITLNISKTSKKSQTIQSVPALVMDQQPSIERQPSKDRVAQVRGVCGDSMSPSWKEQMDEMIWVMPNDIFTRPYIDFQAMIDKKGISDTIEYFTKVMNDSLSIDYMKIIDQYDHIKEFLIK